MNPAAYTSTTGRKASLKRHSKGPVPEEVKQKISQSRAAVHAAARAAMPPLLAGWKVCTQCKTRKRYDMTDAFASDFSPRKRTNADGSVSVYPSPWCKRCQADRKNERYAALPKEERRKRNLKNEDQRSVEARREYSRRHSEQKRRAAGIPPRKFTDGRNRYRPEQPVSITPLTTFLRKMTRTGPAGTGSTAMGAHQLISITELAEHTGVDDKTLHRIRSGKGATVELRIVDKVLTHFDAVHLLAIWYPEQPE